MLTLFLYCLLLIFFLLFLIFFLTSFNSFLNFAFGKMNNNYLRIFGFLSFLFSLFDTCYREKIKYYFSKYFYKVNIISIEKLFIAKMIQIANINFLTSIIYLLSSFFHYLSSSLLILVSLFNISSNCFFLLYYVSLISIKQYKN